MQIKINLFFRFKLATKIYNGSINLMENKSRKITSIAKLARNLSDVQATSIVNESGLLFGKNLIDSNRNNLGDQSSYSRDQAQILIEIPLVISKFLKIS